MISRQTEDLQTVMAKLKPIIENKQSIEVTIDSNTLGHLHDAILLTKMIRERATNINKLKTAVDEVSSEIAEMNADYYSEAEDLAYCVFDAILQDSIKILSNV